MQQVIVGGYNDALFGAATEYNCLMGGFLWTATEANRLGVTPTGGTLSSLFIELSANIAASASGIFTIMKNGVAQALTCTVTAGTSTASDITHSVSYVAGDTVSIRATYTGTPGTPICRWTTLWEGTTAGESICLVSALTSTSISYYFPIQGIGGSATENQVQQPAPTPGTLKKLYVQLSEDPGTDPDAYSITLRSSAVPGDTLLTCTIVANNTTGNDTAHEIDIAAGDLLDIEVSPISTPSAAPRVAIGMVFVADTDGESLIMSGASEDTPSTSGTEYLNLCGVNGGSWNATEALIYSLIQACTIKNLYVNLSAAPGLLKSYTISINKDAGAASGLTVLIENLATTGNDTTHTYDPADGDTADIKCVPASTPAATYVNIGLVCYIVGIVNYEETASVSIGVLSTASRLTAFDRNSSVLVGILITASRGWAHIATSTVLIGVLITASRLNFFFRSASIIIGDLVSASKIHGFVKSASTSIGNLVTASRLIAFTRSASVLIGNLVSASRAWGRAKQASVSIGELITASGIRGFIRTASVSIGNLITASRSLSFIRSANIAIGVLTTASRLFASIRASNVSVGVKVSASRLVGFIRSVSTSIGILISASKVWAINRTASVAIGVLTTATRLVGFLRSASVSVGELVSATRLTALNRTSSVLVGIVVSGSRVLGFIRQANVVVGNLVSATRGLGYFRTASVNIGNLVSASRLLAAIRQASTSVGILTTATKAQGFNRTPSVIVGILVTATRIPATIIRSASVSVGVVVTATSTFWDFVRAGINRILYFSGRSKSVIATDKIKDASFGDRSADIIAPDKTKDIIATDKGKNVEFDYDE